MAHAGIQRVAAVLFVVAVLASLSNGLTLSASGETSTSIASPTSTQSATPMATNPDGSVIPSSGVFMRIVEEARRVCVPITFAQFGDGSVTFETPEPAALDALVERLGLWNGPTSVVVLSTPPMLTPVPAAVTTKKSPPKGVDVPADIAINKKSRVATMRGLPGTARNSMTDTGGSRFVLAVWEANRWADIGITVDRVADACPVGWFAPNARTSFASNLEANVVFHDRKMRSSRWPIWTVRLPKLPRGWYRLTTGVSITGNVNARAGATFPV